jgi:integrase
MLRKATRVKPDKPYKGFPLTAHRNGQWCKKIRGKVYYFGPWEDWQGSLATYRDQRDDLHAGRTPRPRAGGVTLADVMNAFLNAKQLLVETGELTQRSFNEYKRTCDQIRDSLGANRLLDGLAPTDFEKLRADLAKGNRGRRSASTLKGDVGRARMVFLYAILYRKSLRAPSQRILRKQQQERGPLMFERNELQAILKAVGPQLRAMIYLGINCGFGNNDCATLPLDTLNLDKGWHHYWRPKTGNPRRCPLWPETVKALKAAIAKRPKPKRPTNNRVNKNVFGYAIASVRMFKQTTVAAMVVQASMDVAERS